MRRRHTKFRGHYNPMAGLAAVVAKSCRDDDRKSQKRLANALKVLVPEPFHPAIYEWMDIIQEKEIDGFFQGLPDLNESVQFEGSKTDRTSRPLLLIADDDHTLRQLYAIILSHAFGEKLHFVTIASSSGALVLASTLMPDLILGDLMRPDMDGLTCMEYIRSNPKTREIPFAFCTAVADTSAMAKGFELGAKAYITKPFLASYLIQTLEPLLGITAITDWLRKK
jgi:CheY-like chemotaxis protein